VTALPELSARGGSGGRRAAAAPQAGPWAHGCAPCRPQVRAARVQGYCRPSRCVKGQVANLHIQVDSDSEDRVGLRSRRGARHGDSDLTASERRSGLLGSGGLGRSRLRLNLNHVGDVTQMSVSAASSGSHLSQRPKPVLQYQLVLLGLRLGLGLLNRVPVTVSAAPSQSLWVTAARAVAPVPSRPRRPRFQPGRAEYGRPPSRIQPASAMIMAFPMTPFDSRVRSDSELGDLDPRSWQGSSWPD
jgi:hypothetical protein